MVKLVNRAKVETATTGTGTITLGAAADGFQDFASAGVSNGDVVRYVIEDGDNWEIGTGTFDATGGTLTRTPSESSASGSPINLTGDAVVFISATATDVQTNVNITGGTINNAVIGGSTAAAGSFTTLTASSTATFNTLSSSGATITGGTINGTTIGATTASTGSFTTLLASTSLTTPLVTNAGTIALSATGANIITASTNGAEHVRVTSAGLVGIATTTPAATLDVGGTGAVKVPVGTAAQRPTPATGQFRFNSDLVKFEGYNGTAWGAVGGGATGGGADEIFIQNGQTVTTNYTIPATVNAMSTGNITINAGVTVTVSTGSRWVVI